MFQGKETEYLVRYSFYLTMEQLQLSFRSHVEEVSLKSTKAHIIKEKDY